ncbi:hypothetical protein HK414_09770 [Ramlibacter terrae]|uniref:Glycosyltransferase RgtA/B/C/D-like domain-containing protein n=1 Tax=Ramlibacter terrae TaxID=2732511 RepID=A0ABX6P3H9_9BURK|nr:hypothetical protein HK414_09770 [Ramlibacter terrae]
MIRTLAGRLPRALIAAALPAVALGHALWLFSLAGKGFDLTDESVNTLIAMFPDSQSGLVTPAGYFTTFVWALSGDSIPVFRLIGMGVLLACVAGAAAAAATYARSIELEVDGSAWLFLLAAACGATAFFYKDFYTVGPSYNWLAMAGLLVVQAGFFLLLSGSSAAAALAIGIGGFLAFSGKPTSGVGVLAALVFTCLFLPGRWRYLRVTAVGVAIAVAAGVAFIVLFTGGLAPTYRRFVFGVEYLRLVESNHSVTGSLAALAKTLAVTPWKVFLFTQKVTIAVMLLGVFVAWRRQRSTAFALAGLLLLSGAELSFHDISDGTFNIYVVTSFPATLLGGVVALKLLSRRDPTPIPLRAVLLPLLFGAGVAISHVFGTNTAPGNKLILPVVAIVLPLMLVALWAEQVLRQRGVTAAVALVAVVAGAVMLHRSADLPFRIEGGLARQTEPVTFLNQSGAIRLDPVKAAYATDILRSAASAGWQAGTPLLNLTGHTPGVNVILDAPFVGSPLLINGPQYRGGQNALGLIIGSMAQETRSGAWVFTSTNGKLRRTRASFAGGEQLSVRLQPGRPLYLLYRRQVHRRRPRDPRTVAAGAPRRRMLRRLTRRGSRGDSGVASATHRCTFPAASAAPPIPGCGARA